MNSSPQQRGTVLLVEDTDIVRRVAMRALEKGGFYVLEAKNGVEAVRYAATHAHPIAMVLTDIVMPEKNGPEVVQEIRTTHPESRVLYMSGYSEEVIHERGLLPPGSHFIEKTFTTDTLLRKVEEILL